MHHRIQMTEEYHPSQVRSFRFPHKKTSSIFMGIKGKVVAVRLDIKGHGISPSFMKALVNKRTLGSWYWQLFGEKNRIAGIVTERNMAEAVGE